MLESAIFLVPLLITLFWTFVLFVDVYDTLRSARTYLGLVYLVLAAFTLSLILYYHHLTIYLYFDLIYKMSSLVIPPMLYIYLKLVMGEKYHSFSKNYIHYIAPLGASLIYLVSILLTPQQAYTNYLDGAKNIANLQYDFINFGYNLTKLIVTSEAFLYIILGARIFVRYQKNIKHFLANRIQQEVQNTISLFTFATIFQVIIIVQTFVSRSTFVEPQNLINISVGYSILAFALGFSGNRQSRINNRFENFGKHEPTILEKVDPEQQFKTNLATLFSKDKIHLNPDLSIHDVAARLNTNRTYVSEYINKKHRCNFSVFVNRYRIKDLEQIIRKHPNYTMKELSTQSGFGSFDSMKRAVALEKKRPFNEWKESITKE